jgi:hypothetical protein
MVPRPRRESGDGGASEYGVGAGSAFKSGAGPDVSDVPSPPHLAGTEELGASGGETDWWRIGAGGAGSLADTDRVPGFTGGVEIPEILKPPPRADLRKPGERPGEAGGGGAAGLEGAEGFAGVEGGEGIEDVEDTADAGARGARRFLPRRGARIAPAGGWTNPLLLLAAAALVAGAVLGNVLALLIGWAVVYLSRRLTMGQKKMAVFGLPGLAAVGGIVWLWGRSAGRWGAPIADGRMSGAVGDTWPWVLRCAAVGSALYLVWRSQRARG